MDQRLLVILKIESLIELEAMSAYFLAELGEKYQYEDIYTYKFFDLPNNQSSRILNLVTKNKVKVRPEVNKVLELLLHNEKARVLVVHDMPVMMATYYLESCKLFYDYICHSSQVQSYLQAPYIDSNTKVIDLLEHATLEGSLINDALPQKEETAVAVEEVKEEEVVKVVETTAPTEDEPVKKPSRRRSKKAESVVPEVSSVEPTEQKIEEVTANPG